MPVNQLQHYIPRFLLRRFGTGKKDWLHVFDKHTGSIFTGPAGKLAAENSLYDFEFQQKPLTMEPSLAKLDGRASTHIRHIVEAQRLHTLEPMERDELACFFAVQMIRTRAHFETLRHFRTSMEELLRKEGISEDFFAPDPRIGTGENAERAIMAKAITNAPKDFGPAFADKDWVFLQTDNKYSYIIGDHPLTMFNMIDRSPRGNLGLTVKGIECYFPLTPNLALGMWCKSYREELMKGINNLDELSNTKPAVAMTFGDVWKNSLDILEAIKNGTSLKSTSENVEHFNSLQVTNAERFVFSSNGNFSLVEEMVHSDPELRHGRRIQESTGRF
jgi:hypothetical protein